MLCLRETRLPWLKFVGIEQVVIAANIAHLSTLPQLREMDVCQCICHVCGCEDIDNVEKLVPCPCKTSSAVHPSCAVACKDVFGVDTPLQPCGTGDLKQVDEERDIDRIHNLNSRGDLKSIQDHVKGMKRAWTYSNDQIGTEDIPYAKDVKGDASKPPSEVAVEDSKLGKSFSGHRFNDVSSIVPIKKRKFHMQLSPSPPPLSPSPLDGSPVQDCRNFSPVRVQCTLSPQPKLLPVCYTSSKQNNDMIMAPGDGDVPGKNDRSENGESDPSDDRLRWDLSTDMEVWNMDGKETFCRRIAGAQVDSNAKVQGEGRVWECDKESGVGENSDLCVIGSLSSGGVGDVSKLGSAGPDQVGSLYAASKPEGLTELLEEPELVEGIDYQMQGEPDEPLEARSAKSSHVVDTKPEAMKDKPFEVGECVDGGELQDHMEVKNSHLVDGNTSTDFDGLYNSQEEMEVEEYVDSGIEDHENEGQMQESNSEKQVKLINDGWDMIQGEVEAEEHLDYGDSDCRDADDNGYEVDEENIVQDDDEGKTVLEACSKSNLEEDQAFVEKNHKFPRQNQDGQSKTRRTGWDQLPEGFDSAEEALKAAKENSACRGYGGSWSVSGRRGSTANSCSRLSGVRFGSGRGFTNRSNRSGGEGCGDEFLRGRASFNHGRGFDDDGKNTSRRPMGSHGRGGWIDDTAPGYRSTSSFDNQGSQYVARGTPRLDNSRFGSPVTKPGSAKGVLRSIIGSSHGGVWEPHVNMKSGGSIGKRIAIRDDREILGSSRNSASGGRFSGPGRGPIDGYHGPYYGSGKFDVKREPTHRLKSHLERSTLNSHVPSLRSEARMVRARTPPSPYSTSARSPSKWSCDSRDRREAGSFRIGDGRRSHASSVRVSNHSVHGSFLGDERGQQVLSGSWVSPTAGSALSSPGRARSGSLEGRHSKLFEDLVRHGGSYSKDREHGSRDSGRNEDTMGNVSRQEREDCRKRDFYRPFDKDERSVMGHRHSYSRDGDSDIALRWQQHS